MTPARAVPRRPWRALLGGGALLAALTLAGALILAGPALASPAPTGASGLRVGALTPVVAVAGGPEALPRGSKILGPTGPGSQLSADLTLAPADPAGLAAFDQAVTTPGSPLYRHFLAPGQFRSRFGPPAGALASARSWLAGDGLRLGRTASDGLLIPVSGTAAALGRAFGVGFDQDRLPGGRVVREPTARPRVPPDLAATVTGVVGLDDLARPEPQLARLPPGRSLTDASRLAGEGPHTAGRLTAGPLTAGPSGCNEPGVTATDLAQAYSMSSLYPADQGQGVTVGLYELEPFSPSDIATFESCYSPHPSPTITGVSVDGVNPTAGPGSGESALDIEMLASLAPEADIDVYVGSNLGLGPLDVYAAMIDDDAAQVLSTSWGECEADAGTAEIEAEATLFQQAAAQGQSFLAASGDEGSEDCTVPGVTEDAALAVDDPASQPGVTAVGGTVLGSLGPPPSETVWNTGAFSGTTGGGNSSLWTMPSWQLGPGVESAFTSPDDAFTGASPCPLSAGPGTVSCREVPDVVADGAPSSGFATYCSCGSGGWQTIGGTSMGAPLWAAVTALADQSAATPGRGLGLLNPALYQAGCLASPPFNDVTAGDNQPLGSEPADPPRAGGPDYPATRGYDLASGLGSPIATALLPDLVTPVDACPAVTALDVRTGPSSGGTTVTLSGVNLGAVDEVDFGPGNPGSLRSVSATAVTATSPPSPSGGWATTPVLLKTASDTLGYDNRFDFTFTGRRGYWTTGADGGVFAFGQAAFHGSLGGVHLDKPIVAMAPTPSSAGYWLVASDGGVFAFGDARFAGSLGAVHLDKPIVAMAATPDGRGYWLVASDGGVFAFGDAGFYGSLGGLHLDQPIVAMAASPDGGGYWLVASDGGVFAFGDAAFYGSLGGIRLDKPIVAMAAAPDGHGYWLVASDGGVFAFGDATFEGSLGAVHLVKPIVAMATPYAGGGYWLVASDGGVFAFGRAAFAGSTAGQRLTAPLVAMGGS